MTQCGAERVWATEGAKASGTPLSTTINLKSALLPTLHQRHSPHLTYFPAMLVSTSINTICFPYMHLCKNPMIFCRAIVAALRGLKSFLWLIISEDQTPASDGQREAAKSGGVRVYLLGVQGLRQPLPSPPHAPLQIRTLAFTPCTQVHPILSKETMRSSLRQVGPLLLPGMTAVPAQRPGKCTKLL